jgi:hypothetical protein
VSLWTRALDVFGIAHGPPVVEGQRYRIAGSPHPWRVMFVGFEIHYVNDAGRFAKATRTDFLRVATLVTSEEEQAFREWRTAYREVDGLPDPRRTE